MLQPIQQKFEQIDRLHKNKYYLHYIQEELWFIHSELKSNESVELDFEPTEEYVFCIRNDSDWKFFNKLSEALYFCLQEEKEKEEIHMLPFNETDEDKDIITMKQFMTTPFQYINSLMLSYRVHNCLPVKDAFVSALELWKFSVPYYYKIISELVSDYPDTQQHFSHYLEQYDHLMNNKYKTFDEYIETLYKI